MAGRTTRTRARTQVILDKLRAGLSIGAASDAAGIGRSTYYRWRDEDAEFAAAADDAYESGTDALEDVMLTMAVRGNLEAVKTILRARRPEKYRETTKHEHTGAAGGPIQFVFEEYVPAGTRDE